jgi:hypothetical protein
LNQRLDVALVLDGARLALDQVATLLMASQGGVASDVRSPHMGQRETLLNRLLRSGGAGYPLDDQLRRARQAIADLDMSLLTLRATPGLALTEPIVRWSPPALAEAGSRASVGPLTQARDELTSLCSALAALDTQLLLAELRQRPDR